MFKLVSTMRSRLGPQMLELIFPTNCIICGISPKLLPSETVGLARRTLALGRSRAGFSPSDRTSNRLLCTECLKKIRPSFGFLCPGCDSKSIEGRPCLSCKSASSLDRFFAPYFYQDDSVKEIIHAFKYRFIKNLAGVIEKLINNYLKNEGVLRLLSEIEIIAPIPLTRFRLNWRGYNQSEILAGILAKKLNRPLGNLLARQGFISIPQVNFESIEDRKNNIQGQFISKPEGAESLKNKVVLVVDDVFTTGATMQESARVLKQAGAKEVWGFALARG